MIRSREEQVSQLLVSVTNVVALYDTDVYGLLFIGVVGDVYQGGAAMVSRCTGYQRSLARPLPGTQHTEVAVGHW